MPEKPFIIRGLNRLFITLKDYYIDFYIQRRLIGDRQIDSIDQEYGVHNWHSTTYEAVNNIFFKFKYASVTGDDVIVDVGSGDGKLFNFLLYKGIKNKMLGYEINKKAGIATQKSLTRYDNVTIICEDIFNSFPTDATLFYLFNPFDGKLMLKFIENIMKIKANNPTIIYNYPTFVHLFDANIFNISVIKMHQYKHADGKVAIINFKH